MAKLAAMVFTIWIIAAPQAMAGSLSLSQLATQANQRTQGEFQSSALPSILPLEMAKWQEMIVALQRDRITLEGCLADRRKCTAKGMIGWRNMMLSAAGRGDLAKLRLVNRFFNASTYRNDLDGYGKPDHWATPVQFLATSGDCEDYAIAKLFSLILLGVREDALRIVVVFDKARRLSHAVVSYRMDGKAYILDSLLNDVVRDHELRQYRAVYSMNFTEGWIHVPRGQNAVAEIASEPSSRNLFAHLDTLIGE